MPAKEFVMSLENFVVTPAVMLVLIFGIVEFIKGFGVKGNKLRLIALFIGLLIAAVFKLRDVLPSAKLWIDIVFFTIASGLSASGLYDFLKKFRLSDVPLTDVPPNDPPF
jgi:membrane protein implicated in regulation of membrane protease activity